MVVTDRTPATTARPRPSPAAAWLAGLLAAAGFVALVLWSVAAYAAYDLYPDGFSRAAIPGAVTVNAHPGTYFLYVEGADAATIGGLTIRVTDPGDAAVSVQRAARSPVAYDHDGAMGTVVASFRVSSMGDYRVATTSAFPQGEFAVGVDPAGGLAGWIRIQRWAMAALWFSVVGTAVVLALPAIRRTRAGRPWLLTLVVGLPASVVAAGVWSFFADPVAPSGTPRAEGWRAVLYESVGYLLVLGVAVTALVLAARSLRARQPGANRRIWLSGIAVLLVLAVVGTNVADLVSAPHSAVLNWLVRTCALLIGAVAVVGARAWALRPPAAGSELDAAGQRTVHH